MKPIRRSIYSSSPPAVVLTNVINEYTRYMDGWGFRVADQSTNGVTWTRLSRSGWVIVVCIVTFPIGLLALLAPKREDRITMSFTPSGSGTLVVIAGSGPLDVKRFFEDELTGASEPH
jgi:hypothetical protein